MSQLTRLAISGLALTSRRSWTHLLFPFSDAMYKAVLPSYVYVKEWINNDYCTNDIKVFEKNLN